MLNSLSLVSIVPAIAHATHQLARQGEWSQVFNQIAAYPDVAYIADQAPVSSGWTLFDHAIFQKNIAAFNIMRNDLHVCMAPQARALFPHMINGDWLYIVELLKERIINPNVSYVNQEGNAYTLLDIATLLGKIEVAEKLRATFGALTHETLIQRAMFQAAKEKNWERVYCFIDEKPERVDYIDNQTPCPSLLLEHAFVQRDSDVILTLIDEYHADIELLANINRGFYDSVMGIYEYAKMERGIEQLTASLASVTLSQESEALPNVIAKNAFLIPGFEAMQCPPSGIARLKQDFPGEDQRLTFRGQPLIYS